MSDLPEVLLVDDDATVIELLGRALSGHARLRFARSGPQGLRLAQEQAPDLMLLDVELPGLSGIEVLRQLKRDMQLRHLPVIIITSHRDPHFETAMFEAGAVDFLAKPLTPLQVLARVQSQLRLHHFLQAPPMPAAFSLEQRAHLMVVDDDVSAIQMLEATLKDLVGHIRFAANGSRALEMMRDEAPDLLLLDVRMPGVDGFAVCRAMRDDPMLCRVPIALLTRFADAESEVRGLEAGATDFIAKPFRPAVLQARVRNLLRLKHDSDLALRALGEHGHRLGDARVAELVAASADAMVGLDSRGQLLLINASACALFGVNADAVLGAPAMQALPSAGELLDWAAHHREAPAAVGGLVATVVDAARRHRRVEPVLLRLGRGPDAVSMLLLRDVTDREDAQQQALARAKAEAASQAKSMMLAYISHEVGNPLNAVLGYAQLMTGDVGEPLPPVQAQRLEKLMSSAWLLQSLVRDVMDLSQLESGKLAVQLSNIDAHAAARGAVDSVGTQAATAGVTVSLEIAQASCAVLADAGRLQQCLGNLLSNAVKYNRPNGSVILWVKGEAEHVTFEVIDTGFGMDARQIEHLFEPFNRLGRGDGPIRGAGIGLVVTRLLCRAMRGDLTVSSTVGEGSTFALKLPYPEFQGCDGARMA